MTNSPQVQDLPADRAALAQHYSEHGWVAVPHVFDADEVDEVAAVALEVSLAELAQTASPSYTVDTSGDGRMAPRKIDWPFLKHEAFRRLVLDERLVRIVESVLGSEPCLIRDQLFMKPPKFGSAKPYHQENAPLKIEPADHFVVAWIALDDVDEANGCLRYIDRSHRSVMPHEAVPGREFDIAVIPESYDPEAEVCVPIAKGGVLLHHGLTLHSSADNRSDRWRRAHASHWVSTDVSSETDALTFAYSRRIGSATLDHTCP